MAIYGNIENLDAVILGDITAEPIHIDGEDGRGVVSARINAQQHLIITYTDGTTEDAGAVGEGAGVIIDPTLSIEGAAAEAKATGEWVERLNDTLNEISVCIPSQASYSNQLADKAFVNSTVGTNTAIFRGTFNSLAELQAYTGEKTNNDYAFVIATDVNGNTVYNRYKFNGSSWVFEYALNNSSFTAAQWAAISSGITAALVASYNAHIVNSGIHVTAAQKNAWNGKLTDAPSDGKQYARKNGAWSEVQSGGGADNTFVVTGEYNGGQWGGFDKTFAEILAAHESKKVVMLYLATDDVTCSYTMPLICYYDDEMIFGCPDKLNYSGGNHSNIYVHVYTNNVWSVSYDDYLTLGTLPIYNGGVE